MIIKDIERQIYYFSKCIFKPYPLAGYQLVDAVAVSFLGTWMAITVQSCRMPGLPTHLLQEINIFTTPLSVSLHNE